MVGEPNIGGPGERKRAGVGRAVTDINYSAGCGETGSVAEGQRNRRHQSQRKPDASPKSPFLRRLRFVNFGILHELKVNAPTETLAKAHVASMFIRAQ